VERERRRERTIGCFGFAEKHDERRFLRDGFQVSVQEIDEKLSREFQASN
jgi:hypothetical protein